MLIVKKFGGTSVANKERIFNVASRCIEETAEKRDGYALYHRRTDVCCTDGNGDG